MNVPQTQIQVFRLLYAIWPKSKDLYPTYLKATQSPSILRQPPHNHNNSAQGVVDTTLPCKSANIVYKTYIKECFVTYTITAREPSIYGLFGSSSEIQQFVLNFNL